MEEMRWFRRIGTGTDSIGGGVKWKRSRTRPLDWLPQLRLRSTSAPTQLDRAYSLVSDRLARTVERRTDGRAFAVYQTSEVSRATYVLADHRLVLEG